jgi:hypothetical protein
MAVRKQKRRDLSQIPPLLQPTDNLGNVPFLQGFFIHTGVRTPSPKTDSLIETW